VVKRRDERFILAIRVKYLTQVAMFSSLGSSERSSMCEEKRGTPCSLK
jgi:hypothetical protein